MKALLVQLEDSFTVLIKPNFFRRKYYYTVPKLSLRREEWCTGNNNTKAIKWFVKNKNDFKIDYTAEYKNFTRDFSAAFCATREEFSFYCYPNVIAEKYIKACQ